MRRMFFVFSRRKVVPFSSTFLTFSLLSPLLDFLALLSLVSRGFALTRFNEPFLLINVSHRRVSLTRVDILHTNKPRFALLPFQGRLWDSSRGELWWFLLGSLVLFKQSNICMESSFYKYFISSRFRAFVHLKIFLECDWGWNGIWTIYI